MASVTAAFIITHYISIIRINLPSLILIFNILPVNKLSSSIHK
ncbi:putative membrane protein [Escherichia coli 07798]|nr:putative membrane protein [Escherichia coli 07798]KDZ50626.1 putative membrane protein [Escherichia coli 3-073-06_S1_C1]